MLSQSMLVLLMARTQLRMALSTPWPADVARQRPCGTSGQASDRVGRGRGYSQAEQYDTAKNRGPHRLLPHLSANGCLWNTMAWPLVTRRSTLPPSVSV